MIGYVMLGTSDLEKSGAFYDTLLKEVNASRVMEVPDYFIAWAKGKDQPSIAVTLPFNKEAQHPGNGNMTGIHVNTPEDVKCIYEKAISLGGSCEGKPGFRPEEETSGFYAGYFRDLDGNKLNAFCIVPPTTEN